MIRRLVKMTFREEAVEAFQDIFATSKDKIRAFPGNQHVELLHDVNNPCIFFTFSLWESEADLNNYRHSELFADTWARTKVLFADKPEAWSTDKEAEGHL